MAQGRNKCKCITDQLIKLHDNELADDVMPLTALPVSYNLTAQLRHMKNREL